MDRLYVTAAVLTLLLWALTGSLLFASGVGSLLLVPLRGDVEGSK
jgi:hypothetical protein